MPESPTRRQNLGFVLLLLTLAAFKLWLCEAQTILALAYKAHDDQLFLTLAGHIAQGNWLGPYDKFTLIKGPFYPAWVAAAFLVGVPLLRADQALYALACLVTVAALRPIVNTRTSLLAVYVLLLFNPMSDSAVVTRVLREGIYPALSLLVIACALALMIRAKARPRRRAWYIGFGIALAAFWLTREEGVWLVPSIGFMLALAVTETVHARAPGWRHSTVWYATPVLICAALIAGVSGLNEIYYGRYLTVEFKSSGFVEAYAALARIKHAQWNPMFPVPLDARARAYGTSPAFAELRPYLEGDIGHTWSREGGVTNSAGVPDITGAAFAWALRDSAAAAGHTKSASDAMTYYQQLANEINSACARHSLACAPPRHTMMPVWERGYQPLMRHSLWRAMVYLTTFDGFAPWYGASKGSADQLAAFQRFTHEPLAVARPIAGSGAALKLAALTRIGAIYHAIVPPLCGVALLLYVALGVRALQLRRRNTLLAWVAASAVLAALLARLSIVALIDVSSWPDITPMYLAPAYPLLLLFATLPIVGVIESFTGVAATELHCMNEPFSCGLPSADGAAISTPEG